jgi:LEA14-like dessication related protein
MSTSMPAAPASNKTGRVGPDGSARWTVVALALLGVAGCAGMPAGDPVQITVAGIEPMAGEGLEMRMMVSLRVQNPNDTQIDYDGTYVKLIVQGKTFATGVSDASGSVPRFGEAVIAVPVTVSMLNVMRQVIGAIDARSAPPDQVTYSLEGKLHRSGFSSLRFKSQGELTLPGAQQAPLSAQP